MTSRQKRKLREIMELQFAVLETVLYLDTHPEDRTVFKLHQKFAQQLQQAYQEYQQQFTMLFNESTDTDFPWQWIEEPWPWQISY